MITRERDRKIVELVAKGYSNQEIAETLGLALRSVKNYLSPIYGELGLHNRVELTLWHLKHQNQENA